MSDQIYTDKDYLDKRFGQVDKDNKHLKTTLKGINAHLKEINGTVVRLDKTDLEMNHKIEYLTSEQKRIAKIGVAVITGGSFIWVSETRHLLVAVVKAAVGM